VGRDERAEVRPRDDAVHLGEELLVARFLLLGEPGERLLVSHVILGGDVRVTVRYRDHLHATIPLSELP